MELPARDYNVCSSCGTQYDPDFDQDEILALRQRWIDNGCVWWSKYNDPPEGWNPVEQLARTI